MPNENAMQYFQCVTSYFGNEEYFGTLKFVHNQLVVAFELVYMNSLDTNMRMIQKLFFHSFTRIRGRENEKLKILRRIKSNLFDESESLARVIEKIFA
jgi:hypothetical protein